MRPFVALAVLLATGCPDQQLSIANSAPQVVLTSPSDGARFGVGVDVVFTAQVSDAQSPVEDLELLWSTDRANNLVGELSIDGENVTYTIAGGTFPSGEHLVTLTALDSFNASGSDQVRIEVEPNEPPTVQFTAPTDGAEVNGALPLTVRVVVDDPEEARLQDLALSWTGPGADTLPTRPDASGVALAELTDLPFGEQSLTVQVFDSAGGSSSATVEFTVFNPDEDSDLDGYRDTLYGGDDCNDDDPDIHPGAIEHCDGVDEDCDELIDEDAEDASNWYLDADGDEYGAPGNPLRACERPAGGGYASNNLDCVDSNREVNPGSVEIPYNGLDDDCSGGDQCDVDGDGFLADLGVCGGTDCNDDEATVHPGAEEIPYDGFDNDCVGGDDCDGDGDGFDDERCGGTDCDDTDPTRFSIGPIEVPTQAPTIQAAIDALCEDGRVDVLAGTYVETIDFGERNLEVIGVGAESVTVSGNGSDSVFKLKRGRLAGMTIQDGRADFGAGVLIEDGVSPVLEDLIITENDADYGGGGIAILNATGTVVMSRVQVAHNQVLTPDATTAQGGGVFILNSRANLTDVDLSYNLTDGVGGGLRVAPPPASARLLTMVRVTAESNEANDHAGISARECNATDTTLVENNATTGHGAGYFEDCEVHGIVSERNITSTDSSNQLSFVASEVSELIHRDNTSPNQSSNPDSGVVLSDGSEGNDLRVFNNEVNFSLHITGGSSVSNAIIAGNEGLGIRTTGGTGASLSHVSVVGNDGGIRQTGALTVDSLVVANNGANGFTVDYAYTPDLSTTCLFGHTTRDVNLSPAQNYTTIANPLFTSMSGNDASLWDLRIGAASDCAGIGSGGTDPGAVFP